MKPILKQLLPLFLFCISFTCHGQVKAIGIVQNFRGPETVLPFVFFVDTITREYESTFLAINGKFIGHSFVRRIQLTTEMDLDQLFAQFKTAYEQVEDSAAAAKPNCGGFKIILTRNMQVVDSVVTHTVDQSTLLFNTFLDAQYQRLDRTNYDRIMIAINGILWTFKPKYYEMVKEK